MRFRFNLGTTDAESKATYQPEQWANAGVTVVRQYDSSLTTALNIYRTQPAVRQVIAFIAENMAQVPIRVYQRVSDDERKFLADHPAQVMFDAPNPALSQYEFARDLVTDLELFDVAFYQRVTLPNGELYVSRMFPDAVELRDSGPFGPETFRVHKADGSYVDLDASQVLYLKGYGTDRGISPMETLRRVLAEDEAAGVYREGLYRNGMRNAGVIERPLEAPDWSEKARLRFLDQLTDRHTGAAGTGRPLLLEEGMTWKSDQVSMRSEEYIAGRELTTKAVANLFRVSPQMLGLSDAPYASITEYNRQLYQNTLAPRMTHLTQSLERQLLTTQERRSERIYFEFNLSAKLRGSFAEQAAIGQIAVGSPWMTVSEWRALMELPPLDAAGEAELFGAEPTAGAPNTGAGATDQPSPSEDGVSVDVPKAATKARTDRAALKRREKYAEQLQEVLDATADRVLRSVKAQPTAEFAKARFTNEIAKDLRPIMETVTVAEGTRKAVQLGGEFDPAYVQHYLDAGANNVGKNVARAYAQSVKLHANDDDGGAALEAALRNTAATVAASQATGLMSFARAEAGKQTGAGFKVWNVVSATSRHPELDGERVKMGSTFSNGLAYPGDTSTGDDNEYSNCQCILDIVAP